MDTLDAVRVREFFESVRTESPSASPRAASVIVTHLLPDRPFLLESLAKITDLRAIVPKPKTVDPRVRSLLSNSYPLVAMSREDVSDPELCLAFLNEHGKGSPLVLADIGGYFSRCINDVAARYQGQFLGVVEDTENGHQKYAAAGPTCPVISVARSPLKAPEDFLVGQSIVYSTEALLRQRGDILHGRTACVLGYGKIGRSIAGLLHARHVRTVVFDTDPVRCVDAMSHGFSVAPNTERALAGAGLVFCATGNRALRAEHFDKLDSGAYVVTVTSSEDEMELDKVRKRFQIKHIDDFVARYSSRRHHFYVLNRGQAVNFIHGAAVGPFIYLVHAEILASIGRLTEGLLPSGIHENNNALRQRIASKWLSVFGPHALRGARDER